MRTRQEGVIAFITLTETYRNMHHLQEYAAVSIMEKSHRWTSVPSPSPLPPPFFFFTNEHVSVRVSASFAFLCVSRVVLQIIL